MINITIPVWGEWHTSVFVQSCLPSLLSPGNLKEIDYKLNIYTDYKSGQLIKPFLPEKAYIIEWEADDKSAWRHGVSQAHYERKFACLFWPDVVVSEGTFKLYRDLTLRNHAIWHHLVRIDYDKAYPELRQLISANNFSKKALARLAIDYEHRLSKVHRSYSRTVPIHCETITWDLADKRMFTTLAATPIIFNPVTAHIDKNFLINHEIDRDYAAVASSDESVVLSLAPKDKDRKWEIGGAPIDPLKIRMWLTNYSSPMNKLLAQLPYKLSQNKIDDYDFLGTETLANLLLEKIFTN